LRFQVLSQDVSKSAAKNRQTWIVEKKDVLDSQSFGFLLLVCNGFIQSYRFRRSLKVNLMARDEDDNDGLTPIGEGTNKFLEQAKKGQSRNFLLVCKGAKVTYLAVRKKPVKKNELNEAKKAGYKGEGYFGVITGKGMELVFNLSLADGYTAEPVKDKILKDFLEEKADFKCKPTFAIVPTLPEVPFDEEDLSNPLIVRFLGLAHKISAVLDINPNAAGEIQQTSTEIRLLLQDGNFDDAEPRINVFETRLSQLSVGDSVANDQTASAPPQPSPPQSPAPAQTDDEALKLKLQETLNKLVPQIKQAVATFPDRKGELLTPVAAIRKQIDDGKLEDAKQGLMGLVKTLKDISSQQMAPPSDGSTDLTERIQRLEPQLLQAVKLNPEKGTALMNLWNFINDKVSTGDAASATKALERLEPALQESLKSAPSSDAERFGIREGLVADRIKELEAYFQQRFEEAKARTVQEVDKLETPIDEYIENAKELVDAINSDLRALYDSVAKRLMSVLKQGTKEEVAEEVESCRVELAGNKLLQEVAGASGSLNIQTEVMEQFADLFLDVTDRMERVLAE
jgi:hypothetical protein